MAVKCNNLMTVVLVSWLIVTGIETIRTNTVIKSNSSNRKEVRNMLSSNRDSDINNGSVSFPLKYPSDVSVTDGIDIQNFKYKHSGIASPTHDNECVLQLCEKCIKKFRHVVWYSQANFVYLELLPQSGINITGSEIIVGENLWVWTFYGKEGALGFLTWPMEFGIWSMGLLSNFVIKTPMSMILIRKSGDCSNLTVGEDSSDMVISNALLSLTLVMLKLGTAGEKYEPSFFCYKTRKIIQSNFVYMLCKHIVCPLEALKYNCCSYAYNITQRKRLIVCPAFEPFEYDMFSWTVPTVVSIVLFAFCPIYVLYLAHVVADQDDEHQNGMLINVAQNDMDEETQTDDKIVLLDEHYHVTLFKTLQLPITRCYTGIYSKASRPCQVVLSRMGRVIIPFLSLIIICLQICLDAWFLHTFVLTSINKGVPMGFRSAIAGYEISKENFLPYLGGPYIAVGMYLFITSVLLVIPSSVSQLLLSGIHGNDADESCSPLCIRLRSIEMFGTVNIRKRHGYMKLYSVFLAQTFMLINGKFWKHVMSVQFERWSHFYSSKVFMLLFPLYIIGCLLESVLCVALYGFPIISFGAMIIKAYCVRLCNREARHALPTRLVFLLLTLIVTASVSYFLFMFCTIFMDACLFVTRVVMFTFTGIVVYPKVSYGYMIFTLTIIYYIWQSVLDFSVVYQRLLTETISTCGKLQRANDREKLVLRIKGFKGIKESLFEYVIENHFPRRKQVVLSVLKVGIVLTVLGLSINILIKTDGFRELHVVMHVGTALFICALPQLLKIMCRRSESKYKQLRFRTELAHTITRYMGYFDVDTTENETD